ARVGPNVFRGPFARLRCSNYLAGGGKTDNAPYIPSRLRDFVTQRRVLSASADSPRSFFEPANTLGLSLRCLNCQIPHTDQVVGGCSKGKVPSHLEDSTVPNLPQQRNRLQPSEALFNAFSLSLTDGISDVLRRASINGTPTGSLQVLGHVRRHL